MAITATHILTDGTSSDSDSYETASINVSANELVLLSVVSLSTTDLPVHIPTVTGASRTWTQVATILNTKDTYRRSTLFRSLSGSGNSGALTIDFGGQTQIRCGWSINEFDTVDTGGTNGADAVVQSATAFSTVSETTGITVTLGAFSSTDNATYGTVRKGNTNAVTQGSGFTELGEVDFETGNIIQTQWRDDNDTSVDFTWTGGQSSTFPTAIAVEIKHEAILKTIDLSETITITDSLAKLPARSLPETITLTDAIEKVQTHGREFLETITIVDTLAKKASKVYEETITIVDTLAKKASRTFSEVITLTDSFDAAKIAVKDFVETITLTDIFARAVTYGRNLTETIIITDTIAKIRSQARTFTEIITITDTFAKIYTHIRSFTETITIHDKIRRYLNGLLISIWSKIEKTTTVFTKSAKPTTVFTKVAKSLTDIWTKREKPEA